MSGLIFVIFYGFSIFSFLGEDLHWDEAKSNCAHPYQCRICRSNCLAGKHITLQLGSNDLLKRELREFPFPPRKKSITVKWSRAFNIILQKFRFSGVREVLLLQIPNFEFNNMTQAERYF